jgi:amino acid adenylation domain-containing protein
MNTMPSWSIAAAIVEAARQHAERPALTVARETFTYREMLAAAWDIAARLPAPGDGEQPTTAIVGMRRCSSYIGVLAALLAGHTYVPFSLKRPAKYNLGILRRSGAQRIVCGESVAEQLTGLLLEAPALRDNVEVVFCPDGKRSASSSPPGRASMPIAMPQLNSTAYILFTSGSTGESKGVPISYENLTGYLDALRTIMDVRPLDRFSQTFELTFDLSEHDLLVCWTNGAHLIVPDERELIDPADYIRRNEITCWFSVPSLGHQLHMRGRLQPDAFPGLRWSLFCGEALPDVLARAWMTAAPSSHVENWYGPTEATIACARYRLSQTDQAASAGDLVPIGKAFPGMEMIVCDEQLAPVEDGTPGELVLHGRQVGCGYLNDPEKTRYSFASLPGQTGPFYRTGDRALRDGNGNVHFLGRLDNQVKIRGHRVELGAIEAAIRGSGCAAANVVALSWPPGEASGTSVIAALECEPLEVGNIVDFVRGELPSYMVPSRIVCLPRFPTNASGKADRKAIAGQLSEFFESESASLGLDDLPPEAMKLMACILSVCRNVAPAQILKAETLMDSGMDSLTFINLTAEIEREFGLSLQEEDVVSLSYLSFHKMVEAVTAGVVPSVAANPVPEPRNEADAAEDEDENAEGVPRAGRRNRVQRRINRTVQFIERFPGILKTSGPPFGFAVGSSGIFRAFVPGCFDHAARECGAEIRSLNIGLPGVSCAGIAQMCQFIGDRCREADVRVPLVILELDPMHICELPPTGDIGLKPEHFSGAIKVHDRGPREWRWVAEDAGAAEIPVEKMRERRRPKWERKRDQEIARTFLGDVGFRDAAIADWARGARALSTVAERIVGFIHPVEHAMLNEVADRWRGPRFAEALHPVAELSGPTLIPGEQISLGETDFLDFNHVNASGAERLTAQLARMCFAEVCA